MPKYYDLPNNGLGWIPDEHIWMEFPTDSEYYEYLEDKDEEAQD